MSGIVRFPIADRVLPLKRQKREQAKERRTPSRIDTAAAQRPLNRDSVEGPPW
jgi:hypothetical protein